MHRLFYFTALMAAALWISSASAAELVMFRRDGCVWCANWDREIGQIYAKTDIGPRAPLRMVDIHDRTEFVLQSRVIYTPTFVLVDNGREIARIEGYVGDHFFWGQLESMLKRLPSNAAQLAPERL